MILGIDPGLENTGWAILNVQSSDTDYQLVGCGVIKTGTKTDNAKRLALIYDEIIKLIDENKIITVVIESLFFFKNAKSVMQVAQAIGVIKAAASKLDCKVYEYTPMQIKLALVGYGKAEKEQVELMVRQCLNLSEPIKPNHASDAVAVGLTYGYMMKVK